MATAPELLATPEVVIRTMVETDVLSVVAIERAAYQFPWSEGIFRDCLRVGYVCRVAIDCECAVASAGRGRGFSDTRGGAGRERR